MNRPGTLEMRGHLATRSADGTLRVAVAILSIGAAWIHFAVTREHLTEFWLFGAFFAAIAVGQAAWAIAVLARPSAAVYMGGVVVDAGIVAIWVVSRTIGMPLGPEPWTPEPLGVLDLLSTMLELLIVAGAAKLILAGTARQQIGQAARRIARIMSAVAITLVGMMATGLFLAFLIGPSLMNGHH